MRRMIEFLRRLCGLSGRVAELEEIVSRLTTEQGPSEAEQNLARRQDLLESARLIETRLATAQAEIIKFVELRTSEVYADLEKRLRSSEAEVSRRIRLAADPEPRITERAVETSEMSHRDHTIDEHLYAFLEHAFRGPEAAIKDRQSSFLNVIPENLSSPVLDIGCGRGEWLEVLRDAGVPGRGVDGNSAFVRECHEKGLDVLHGELPAVLGQLGDRCASGITMFQVAEHLPFGILISTLDECRRVITDDGFIIVEVPNIENLTVGASSFWIDPTHARPLHPAVLEFLLQHCGFTPTQRLYSASEPTSPDFNDLSETTREFLLRVALKLDGPGDVAIVARRS